MLEDGRRYEGEPGTAGYRVTEFERYALRMQRKATRYAGDQGAQRRPRSHCSTVLSDAFRGELIGALRIPVSALVLALLAIPLSFVNARAPRAINLVFALLVYVVYWNLLIFSQARVAQGQIDIGIGAWAVHAVMLGVLLVLYVQRTNPFMLRLRLRR